MGEVHRQIFERMTDANEAVVLKVVPPLGEAALGQVLRKVPAASHEYEVHDGSPADVFIVPVTELRIHQVLLTEAVDSQVVESVEYNVSHELIDERNL